MDTTLITMISEKTARLQAQNKGFLVRFTMYEDCSGSFNYLGSDDWFVHLIEFDNLEKLVKVLAD